MKLVVWMVFEAVSPNEDTAKESLEDHVEKLEEEKGVEILESEFDDVSEIENPHPSIDKGYSTLCEARVQLPNFAKTVEVLINYGPTYIQLEEPDTLEIDLAEGQESLQKIADVMHQYAQSGAGGMLISRVADE